jgi:hypothetical protein
MSGSEFPLLASRKNLISEDTCLNAIELFENADLGESSPLHRTFDQKCGTLNMSVLSPWLPISGLRVGDPMAHLAGLGVDDPSAKFILDELVEPTEKFMTESRGHQMHCLSFSIKKYPVGSFMNQHSDQPIVSRWFSNDQLENIGGFFRNRPFPLFLLDSSCSLLLNEDFDGGEIYFCANGAPDSNPTLVIDQEAGEVYGWPSSEMYKHGIKPVISGERYVFVGHYATKYTLDAYFEIGKMFLPEESFLMFGGTERN